ncbi:hypothetical protein [Streptomyces xanthophaeus]|uniref:Uncharacterized protein n=1 Tax=Streptomyces xanthophaeus TaxID=67385 RepID=A0A919H0A2_9ACTN|nr:hypothetical protein [Streptomyces xanthophaeus]GHI85014.1 hypothetical protein Sxan_23780 [Streptomyces xanthophaeus]
MTGNSTAARLTAFGAAPLIALLTLAPAAPAAAAVPAVPNVCHLLSQPKGPYHLGCREGFRLGTAAGYQDGLACRKLPPPLAPVNPTPHEQGKRQGYVDGYNGAFTHTYERNCDLPKLPPAQKPPQTQTPESMAAAGQAAGATWGKEDARLTCTREHANLVPPTKPDALITAYQNGYRVGYDVAYDEAYRQLCLMK